MTPPSRGPLAAACSAPNSNPSAAVDLILIFSAMSPPPSSIVVLVGKPLRSDAGSAQSRRCALAVRLARRGRPAMEDDPFDLARFVGRRPASTSARWTSFAAAARPATGCGSSSRSSPASAAARRPSFTPSARSTRRAPISPTRCSVPLLDCVAAVNGARRPHRRGHLRLSRRAQVPLLPHPLRASRAGRAPFATLEPTTPANPRPLPGPARTGLGRHPRAGPIRLPYLPALPDLTTKHTKHTKRREWPRRQRALRTLGVLGVLVVEKQVRSRRSGMRGPRR